MTFDWSTTPILAPALDESAMITHYLFEGVKEGLWPFRPRDITIDLDFDIDHNTERIVMESRGPGWWFGWAARVERDEMLDGYGPWVGRLYAEFVDAFRRRWAYPVEDNVVLGSE